MAWKSSYWSCSKFADCLRGSSKPEAATGKEWGQWKRASKEAHPFRYWLTEEGLDYAQDFVTWPMRKLDNLRYYVYNRWITRTHCLTAHPRDIRPGDWHDVGNRFLPCLFNELVDFVEIEQAWHHCAWDDETRKKYHVPWWRRNFPWWRNWRCPDAGVEYLVWASGLKIDDSMGVAKGEEGYGEPTHQAKAAQEILDLYRWWKIERPKRPDVHDASGWTDYCEMRRDKGYDLLDLEDKNPEEAERCRVALDKSRELELQYDTEDEEMMIRLIKIRQSLWT